MIGDHISLFAGIGATDIAVETCGYETIATSEIEPFCQKILNLRYPRAIHLGDIAEVTPSALPVTSRPLLISGGFPCQGVSSAGTALGLDDGRSGLWREFYRVISEFRPDKVLIENSPMLRHRGLPRILCDLHDAGYNARWDCIPAASIGACHLRDRIFIVAEPLGAAAIRGAVWERPDYLGYTITRGMFTDDGQPIHSLPRAGFLNYGVAFESQPLAPIREAKTKSHASFIYPTPTRSDGTGGPGATPKRTGGKNLRTVINEIDGNSRLHPEFVEWMMGLPSGWTDLDRPNDHLYAHRGWQHERRPRTADHRMSNRGDRIRALGNALVPAAAQVALTSYRPPTE